MEYQSSPNIKKCPHNNRCRNQSYIPSDPLVIKVADTQSAWTYKFRNRKFCEFNVNQTDSISIVTVIRGQFIEYTINWCPICEGKKIACGAVTITNQKTIRMTLTMCRDIIANSESLFQINQSQKEHINYLQSKIDQIGIENAIPIIPSINIIADRLKKELLPLITRDKDYIYQKLIIENK
eukprot:88819_1